MIQLLLSSLPNSNKELFCTEICQKGADGMTNSVDSDQTAPKLKEQSDLSIH